MASLTFVKEPNERCGICLKVYKEPRRLPCFDSFCHECLRIYVEEHNRNGIIHCPLCTDQIIIPATGIDAFEPNLYLVANQSMPSVDSPRKCEVCDDAKLALNRCIECEQNLCHICSKIHQRIKSTRDHHLADLNDPEGRLHIKSKSFCPKHNNEEMIFYCNDCSVPVCIRCRLTAHDTHATSDLNDVAVQTRSDLRTLLKLNETQRSKVKEQQKDMSEYKAELKRMKIDVIESISIQTQKIHENVDSMSKQLVDFTEREVSVELAFIEKLILKLEKSIASFNSRLCTISQIVEFGSDSEIVQAKETLLSRRENMYPPKPIVLPNKLDVNFIPCVLDEEDFEGQFGLLTSRVGSPAYTSLSEIVSFRVNDSDDVVNCICPVHDSEALVTCGWSSTVHRVKSSGEKMKTYSVGIDVDFIIQDKFGNIYTSCRTEKCVKKLDEEMNVLETFPLMNYPRGLAMTPEEQLVVCMPQSKTYFDYISSDINTVAVLSLEGNKVQVFGENGNMFLYPIRVATNENGGYIVSDNLSHQIIIFNESGKINFIYYGQASKDADRAMTMMTTQLSDTPTEDTTSANLSELQEHKTVLKQAVRMFSSKSRDHGASSLKSTTSTRQPFDPRGVTCDKHGHMIVTDYSNNAIHLLDHSGRFLELLLTEKDGIFAPTSVAVDGKGYLWIGGGNATIKVYSYIK